MGIMGRRDSLKGRGRRAVRFVCRSVAVLVLTFTGLATLAGPASSHRRGSDTCRPTPDASTSDYLLGIACPPAGFAEAMGYQPVLVETSIGWRYTRPAWANGNCSGPIGNTGLFWDFTTVCQTHDYGYDLVRFGVGDRQEADEFLHRDMGMSCEAQWAIGVTSCKAVAEAGLLVLTVGDSLGFDPERRR
jgi:hypothetical protein